MIKKLFLSSLIAVVTLLCPLSESKAGNPAAYPTKPISVLIGYSPGGSTDVSMRFLCDLASKFLGQPVICENKVGGGGKVALGALAKAAPDGYTIGNLGLTVVTREPYLQEVPFDPLSDFTPIMQYTEYPFSIAVRADSPWKTLKDLVAAMKKDPSKFTVANSGANSGGDLAWRVIGRQEGINIRQIPYAGGGAQAILALLGGHVQGVGCGGEANPHVRSGKLRLLVVLGEKRMPDFPDVPTLKESGYPFSNVSGVTVAGPKGLPQAIVKKLEHAFTEAAKDPKLHEVLKNFDLPYVYANSEQLQKEIPEQYAYWGRLLKELGITATK